MKLSIIQALRRRSRHRRKGSTLIKKRSASISIRPATAPSRKLALARKSHDASWLKEEPPGQLLSRSPHVTREVSDDLYGSVPRYVSKGRLEAMLDSEWSQLVNQLNKSRGSSTRFFPLLIPSLPATTLEQMSLTVGSV